MSDVAIRRAEAGDAGALAGLRYEFRATHDPPVEGRDRFVGRCARWMEPESRGTGLGSALLGVCLAACLAEQVDAVILWPTPRSRSLYGRHGFAVRDDLLERRLDPTLTGTTEPP